MKRIVPMVAAVALMLCSVAVGADLQSGLQVGEAAGYYEVTDVTGPNATKTLCYR